MSHVILPTNVKIGSINPWNKQCPRCNEDDETLVHALKNCKAARETLTKGSIDNRVLNDNWSSGIDWLESSMRFLDSKAYECFIILLWNIWNA